MCPLYTGPIDGQDGFDTALAVQQFLTAEGYDPGLHDGNWGADTSRAFQFYLKDNGFDPGPIDGKMRDGHLGLTVFACQMWLRSKGYSPGVVDGAWGIRTSMALQLLLQEYVHIGTMSICLEQLLFVKGDSSGMRVHKIRMLKGHTHTDSISPRTWSQIIAKVNGVLETLQASFGDDISSGIQLAASFSNIAEHEEETEIDVDMSQPCYIYQVMLHLDLDGKPVTLRSQGFMKHSQPVPVSHCVTRAPATSQTPEMERIGDPIHKRFL